ncbi:single-stranded DNA-binding protein [[Mycoplasma] testudinis]|uniref:single-stranded DNA-binding protein n=1 Tax=[Mycoplasma] testudinis TaxID=33924 RepID=UPI00048116FD|nr:single-stranded DNA-binding protein [[Mycoplasma] testudinis]
MNRVFLAGYLASDPISVPTSTGSPGARISIAAKDARNSNETHFVNCIAWQQTANFILTYLKKGDFLVVDGRLTVNKYVSKEGKNISNLNVMVDNVRTTNSNKVKAQSSREFSNFNKGSYKTNQIQNHMEEDVANLEETFPDTVDLDVSGAFKTEPFDNSKQTVTIATDTKSQSNSKDDDEVDWANDLDDLDN